MQTADETFALVDERPVPPLETNQRLFRIALVFAVLLHAAVFIEVGRSVPRGIGDRSGVSDAISVELVTEADLKSRETVALPPAGAPSPPPAVQPQPEPQPQPTPEPQPQPETAAQPAPPVAKSEPPPKETPQKQEQAALPDFQSALPDLATMPQPTEPAEKTPPAPEKPQETKQKQEQQPEAAKPAEKQTPPAKKKPAPQAKLDPSPQDFQNAPPGRSAAASRPPGITRSGENDEFGRAVIRALRQTMPPPRGIFGRVTVRLLLTPNGDLAEVQLLAPSGTSLDQSVVFATKQTYFPLPPYNATVADRTFLITYVYR
jgi:protein TonB